MWVERWSLKVGKHRGGVRGQSSFLHPVLLSHTTEM